ncbi:MAG: glycosyltransferase family 2 protein [Halanaerobiales bacterium]
MKKGKMISVIIPAYNEAKTIGNTLSNLNLSWLDEIIIVNDGSKDNTGEIVAKYPVKLVDLTRHRGKGKAVEKGINKSRGDIIVLLDADLKESIREIETLIKPVVHNDVDICIGVLPITGGGIGLVRMLADWGLYFFAGKKMKAPLSGQRVFKREILDKLIPLDNGYGLEIGMDMKIIKNNISYQEIECDFRHRITKSDISGYLHRGKQFIEIFSTLWHLRH